MGAYLRNDSVQIKRDMDHMFELFPRLRERRHQLGITLSGGEQQMLAMVRALLSNPENTFDGRTLHGGSNPRFWSTSSLS